MADTLLIHFNPECADSASWSLVNNAGELTTMLAHGSLGDAAAIADKHKTIVLLDSTAIYLDSVKLPIKNPQKLLRAIPFALEEKIADDVDELHFVAGKTSSDGQTPVAAIKHDILKRILNTIESSGIKPVALIPDMLCLTANSSQWAVLLQDDRAKLQFDNFNAAEFDRETLPLLIKTELQRADRKQPEKIILFTLDGDNSTTEDISAIIPEQIELIKVSYNTHPLVIFCGQYKRALALNLLQHTYKPKQKVNVNWQRWRLAASMAAIWFCLNIGITSVQYQRFETSNKKLQVEIDNIYKKSFPESTRVVNARVQMEQKLDELKGLSQAGSNTSMMTLLADSSPALSSEKSVVIQAINYRNNTIDIEVTGANLQNIEQLNKKLNNSSLSAEIVSSSSEKDRVKGNIRIKHTNPS
ncbi:MAG: type II secretion system protein GspL [Gammaproteobacteria bacterium]|nr:type II secretion system protein GspL [Gammaproteobacteria bacterium]